MNEQSKWRAAAAIAVGSAVATVLLAGCGGGTTQVDTHGQIPAQQQAVQKQLEPTVGKGLTAPNGGVPPASTANYGK